jgi:peptidoglycan LD-endopeptidase LytH
MRKGSSRYGRTQGHTRSLTCARHSKTSIGELALHGTPDPGNIRHGESAGYIRMTNWEVDDLSHMVRTRHIGHPGGIGVRLCVCIGVLFAVVLAVGETSSILEMTPPISGLALADLRDTFEEVHHGHRHEAIDILEPRGTPVHAVVPGTIRKLFLSNRGGSTIYQFDEKGMYCYYYAHLERYVEGLREGMRVERGDVLGFVGSTGNADARTPHLHFAIFELGLERLWWKGKAVNPYPGLVDAVKRAK